MSNRLDSMSDNRKDTVHQLVSFKNIAKIFNFEYGIKLKYLAFQRI